MSNNETKQISPLEQIEDVYALADNIDDYFNVVLGTNYKIGDNGKTIGGYKMPTPEEYYSDRILQEMANVPRENEIGYQERLLVSQAYYGEFMQDFLSHPKKTERINKLVAVVNTTGDVTILKRALNEITRLLYGRDWEELPYPGSEFNPDLLEI